MKNEAEIILSFLFKRSGKTKLRQSDIYLSLALDLNWFSISSAKTFLKNSLEEGLLQKQGEYVTPNFNWKKIEIPIGYHPSKDMKIPESPTLDNFNILDELIDKIAEKTGYDKKSILDKINSISSDLKITFEVAALLICKDFNINYEVYLDKIEKKLFKKNI
jgi:hypothetical protein